MLEAQRRGSFLESNAQDPVTLQLTPGSEAALRNVRQRSAVRPQLQLRPHHHQTGLAKTAGQATTEYILLLGFLILLATHMNQEFFHNTVKKLSLGWGAQVKNQWSGSNMYYFHVQ